MADGTRPRKLHTFLLSTVLFFSVQSSSSLFLSSSCARDPEQNGPNIRNQGVSSEELPDPYTELRPPAPGKKGAETAMDACTKPHWTKSGPGSKCRRTPSFQFRSNAAHDVKVRTKVPSNRSCRARKHLLAVKGGHVLSEFFLLRCVLCHLIQRVVQGSLDNLWAGSVVIEVTRTSSA